MNRTIPAIEWRREAGLLAGQSRVTIGNADSQADGEAKAEAALLAACGVPT